MRFGRILLALLAPLLSLPALKADTSARKPATVDSLTAISLVNLLLAVAPAAVNADSKSHATHSNLFEMLALPAPARRSAGVHLALQPISTEATLRLLSRGQQRNLLRC